MGKKSAKFLKHFLSKIVEHFITSCLVHVGIKAKSAKRKQINVSEIRDWSRPVATLLWASIKLQE